MTFYFDYDTPLGKVRVVANEVAISETYFTQGENRFLPEWIYQETPLLQTAGRQIQEYFNGNRQVFDLPLAPVGSDFFQEVWRELIAIPFGMTRSYGELAKRIHRPKAARAVGRAAHCNPIGIIIPCHRLIGSNGSLVGYAGGLDLKAALLAHEREVMV